MAGSRWFRVFFVWVGDVLLPLPLSFPPCPVGEMPGESDGLSPPGAASRKDGRTERVSNKLISHRGVGALCCLAASAPFFGARSPCL